MTSTGSILKTPISTHQKIMETQFNHDRFGQDMEFEEDMDFASDTRASTPFRYFSKTSSFNRTVLHRDLDREKINNYGYTKSSWVTPTPSINRTPKVAKPAVENEGSAHNMKRKIDSAQSTPTTSGFQQPRPLYSGMMDQMLLRNPLGSCKAIKLDNDPSTPIRFKFSPFEIPKISSGGDQGGPKCASASIGIQTSPVVRRG